MNKRSSQRKHALRRALERFDLRLTKHDLNAIRKQIQEGRALLVTRQSRRVTAWRVELPDGSVRAVVYDCQRKQVVTFLTDEMAATLAGAPNVPEPDAQSATTSQANSLAVVSFSGQQARYHRADHYYFGGGDALTLYRSHLLERDSSAHFRGINEAKAGNFSRWKDLHTFLGDLSVAPALKRTITEFIEQRRSDGAVPREGRATLVFDYIVGWSRTIGKAMVPNAGVELQAINTRAEAMFVTDESVQAPLTHSVGVVYRVHEHSPRNWQVVLCSVSPGPNPGRLRGNITNSKGLYFFSLDHCGGKDLVFD